MRMWLLLFFLITSSCYASTKGFSEQAASLDIVDEVIDKFMQQHNVNGVAVAIYKNGKAYLLHYGYADRKKEILVTSDTLFEIASITKVFTTTEIALQIQKHQMMLTDSVSLYLPEIDAGSNLSDVTIMQLATHTSGLPRRSPNGENDSQKGVVEFLKQWTPKETIGTHYCYSNLAYGILGYALEAILKKSYFQVIEDDILKPLGMTSTMIEVPSDLLPRYAQGYSKRGVAIDHVMDSDIPASGALRASASDLLKFLKANLNVEGPAELRAAMLYAQKGYFKVNDGLTMGLGWHRARYQRHLIVDKNGGHPGFSSYIGMLPEAKVGIVILANRGKTNITRLGRDLLILLAHSS